MSAIEISPGPIEGRVRAPPSKSYTHRALVAGYLTGRAYHVHHPNDGDDARATRDGLTAFGARFELRRNGWTIQPGSRPAPARRDRPVECRSSGSTLRLLTSLAALREERRRFRGSAELARRPMDELIAALRAAGARFDGPPPGRALPFAVRGRIRPGEYRVPGGVSSQFVSSLLFALPGLAGPSTLRIEGDLVSRPYVDATLAVLAAHGITVDGGAGTFRVPAPQTFQGRQFFVPGDASSAAYLWAAAAVSGGRVRVTGFDPRWPQADLLILEILHQMGATVRSRDRGATVEGPLRGGCDVDLTGAPDLFPLIGALAAVTPGARSRLRGAPQLVHKESDRRSGTESLARALGADVRAVPGALEIRAGSLPLRVAWPRGSDHRMIMASAVAAFARGRPSRFEDARAVGKSFPEFWATLGHLGAHLEVRP